MVTRAHRAYFCSAGYQKATAWRSETSWTNLDQRRSPNEIGCTAHHDALVAKYVYHPVRPKCSRQSSLST